MDQKSWLWKKRSTEKTLVADKAANSLSKNDEEEEATKVQKLLTEKTDLERDLRISNEKLSSAVSECYAKDNVAKKQVKIAEEALAGWEKAETEAIHLKQELEKVLQQKAASEERTGNLDAALKECMQQLRFVREEQEKRVHNAVMKTSEEFEKIRIALNEKLVESGKRVALLTKALSGKEKVIEDLGKYKDQGEAKLKALLLRLESMEKENASLKYEVRVLEKELDIRNEEREFNRRIADVDQKQQRESAKEIARLETDCQQLRLLVQKRLPDPATLARMKSEVETLGKGKIGTRRKSNPSPDVEKPGEYFLQENFLAASSDVASDDKVSCAESCASALISELEHFKNEKQMRTLPHRNMGNLEINLMDDFAEMEKLAVISVDYPAGSSHHSSEEGNVMIPTLSVNNILNMEKSGEKIGPNVSISVHKVLALLEGILSYKDSDYPTGYIVRAFQWKGSELSAILQQFVGTCNELLNGQADLEQFVLQVASNLEWIMNHCFSIQDVSSMKDAIRNHLDWDESRSGSDADRESTIEDVKTWKIKCAEEESSVVDLDKAECFMIQLQESKDVIENLHLEMVTVEESQGKLSNQIEKQRMIKEDLEMQLMNTNHEFRKSCEKMSHLEKELENKSDACKELEETCHDLRIQLQSMTSNHVSNNGKHREKHLQSDWEITAASAKLAECQETILNLGKQLKALASPSDAALFDKVITTTADSVITTPMKNISRRSSLRNKMLAEDNDPHVASPNTQKDDQNGEGCSAQSTNADMENSGKFTNSIDINHEEKSRTEVGPMDIIPCKKNGGRSFWKKLFRLHKRGNSDKPSFS